MATRSVSFIRGAVGAAAVAAAGLSAAHAAHLQGQAQTDAVAQAGICVYKAQYLESATDTAPFELVGNNPRKPDRTEAGLEMTADGILSGLQSTRDLLGLDGAKQDKAVTEVAKAVDKLDKYILKLEDAIASGALLDPYAIETLRDAHGETATCTQTLQAQISF